jgi:hypothetical protein
VVRVATTSSARAALGCMLCRRSTRTVPTVMARISRCLRCVCVMRFPDQYTCATIRCQKDLPVACPTRLRLHTRAGSINLDACCREGIQYRGEGDAVVVCKLDRFRNTLHILETRQGPDRSGATFVSVTDGIDSYTPAGRMMIGVLGSLAEYERELTKERTALKRAVSRADGTKFGRSRKVTNPITLALLRLWHDRPIPSRRVVARRRIGAHYWDSGFSRFP